MRPLILLLVLLTLRSFSASSQPSTARTVCFSELVAERLLDSLRHLPTVRWEASEWHRAYDKAREAAVRDSAAAVGYHQAVLHSQVAFSGQQLLLADERTQKNKYQARARRKGWVITALLTGFLGFLYLTRS